ncbi:BTAD domain-containing putative transcriptional regulator [Curtobacterium sp. MCPF17_002]|uniref:BTAD domain-containing putative transcriptional regulator n=1 Tax=Curtobacterium sp. MCPF17_002 TaxID=2175645 RepID=UPI000DA79CE2|nr:BTAD domain-containing putative transcriptional regulator [Curtobacterium sp. MCPF17_002]WIB77268.1 BTAD domain-containing putative transcriptional regulator [Curtobacterium sp. MCPF17_002]
MPEQPRVAVLGPVTVAGPSGLPTPVPGALARSFLTALVLARGHAVTTEALIDELWPADQPRGARAALQTLVSRLRRTLADGVVVSTSTGYALGCDPDDVDLARAERSAADHAAPDVVRAALDLWRGTPGDDVDGDLGDALAERAAAARRALRRSLGTALLDAGHADEAVDVWTTEAQANPFDEVAVAGCMHALVAAGRTAEALAVFAAHRDRLVDELGADPSADLVRLNADLLRRSAADTGRARRIGLRAAPNALVGRQDDVDAVTDLLSRNRLVTILGAGGLGKTRLAQAVAADVPATCGVVVFELAPLAAEDVVPALGALLGIAEFRSARSLRDVVVADLRSRVVRALADGPTLLVLDNCEHLVDAVAAIAADLLAAAPELRILTTSRSPLAIAGEAVAPLAPLPVEADGAAVRLFTERARAARPGAVLPVDAVRRICTRLDGSPLAIELAAARIRGMSAADIERRLDDRFALLRGGDRSAPERHRTLLAVIEWSWRLLDTGAQDLLTRLALFPDGLAVDAVEAVAAPDRRDDALDDLAELVEQSLVQLVEHEGEPVRYRLLETVREFGAARLDERGTTDAVRRAMIGWGRDFAADRNLFTLTGEAQLDRFREVGREADNLVTLLRWALGSGDGPAVAHLFAALGGFWTLRGAHGEVVAIGPEIVPVLRRMSQRPEDRPAVVLGLVVTGASSAFTDRRTAALAVSTLRRTMRAGATGFAVLDAQAALLLTLGRPADGHALLARYRDDADPGVACLANMLSAPLAENDGDFDDALRYAKRAAALARVTDDAWTTGSGAVTMTQLLAQTGRHTEALEAAEVAREQLERFGADDDLYEIGWTIGLCAASTGDVVRARSIAADLQHRPVEARGGFDGDRAQIGVLAVAIGAECARYDGDFAGAAAEYARAWDFVFPYRKQTPHWSLMAGAARLAAEDEAAASAPAGAEPRLQADANRTAVARRLRVGALVMLRVHPWWLDLPVIGTAFLGLAIAAARTGRADHAARCWSFATRLGSRQDFAVLLHTRVRPVLAAVVGDAALADAETASAGWDRAEAVARARLLLEELRFTPSACTPGR